MRPAVLATLSRSGRIESVHRGSVAVTDADGRLLAAAGAADQPSYYRSACKPIQLIPSVEEGIVERLALGERHLAVMSASHSAAPQQLAAVREILAQSGLGPEALGCGFQPPRNQDTLRRYLTGEEAAAALHNNCSGKHAGMLALSVMMGVGPDGYLDAEHPAQRRIVACVADHAGIPLADAHFGVDGCSAPTLYAPLRALALAFARFARAGREADSAAARIGRAMARCPEMLGEPDSFQFALSAAAGTEVVGKYGAEGLFCVAVPAAEIGFAVRLEDGARRAIGPVVLDILIQLGVLRETDLGALAPFREPTLTNWRGTEIGTMRSDVVLVSERPAHDPVRRAVRS